MLDLYNSLPQFIQLCIGMAVLVVLVYGGVQAVKMRRLFTSAAVEPTFDDKLATTRKTLYDKMEALSRRHDDMIDKLEERIRLTENELAGLKGQIRGKRGN